MDSTFFYYDPDDNGFETVDTLQIAIDRANDAIHNYYDEGWEEGVDRVCIGVILQQSAKTDIKKRPPDSELDKEGNDKDGQWWGPDYDEICNYKLQPVQPFPVDMLSLVPTFNLVAELEKRKGTKLLQIDQEAGYQIIHHSIRTKIENKDGNSFPVMVPINEKIGIGPVKILIIMDEDDPTNGGRCGIIPCCDCDLYLDCDSEEMVEDV